MSCNACTKIKDKQPADPLAGFEIEIISCDLDPTMTKRTFIYTITAINNPPHDISNIKICLPCALAFVEGEVNIDGEITEGEFSQESGGGDPVICAGVKYDSLPDNKTATVFTLSITVLEEYTTISNNVQIGYKAATNKYIWTLCGPECNGHNPNHHHKERGIKF